MRDGSGVNNPVPAILSTGSMDPGDDGFGVVSTVGWRWRIITRSFT